MCSCVSSTSYTALVERTRASVNVTGEAVTCEGWRVQYGSSVHIHMSLRWHLQFSIRRELT